MTHYGSVFSNGYRISSHAIERFTQRCKSNRCMDDEMKTADMVPKSQGSHFFLSLKCGLFAVVQMEQYGEMVVKTFLTRKQALKINLIKSWMYEKSKRTQKRINQSRHKNFDGDDEIFY